MTIIGIDYSMNGPSICVLGPSFKETLFYYGSTKKKSAFTHKNFHGHLIGKDYVNNITRYESLAKWAISVILPCVAGTPKIAIEGYAFGASAGLIANIAENGGMLKYLLYKEWGVTPEIVSPTQLKKWWAGKGNAKKEDMAHALLEREGVDIRLEMMLDTFDSPVSDVVDSYALARWLKENS